MQKVAAFFEIYPPLHDLRNSADWLCEFADGGASNSNRELPPGKQLRPSTYEVYRNSRFVPIMQSALADERVQLIEKEWLVHLRNGLDLFTNATRYEDFFDAEVALGQGLDKLVEYLDEMMLDVFGEWGTRFFKYIIDPEGQHTFEKIEAKFCALRKNLVGSPDPDVVQSLIDGALELKIDDSTFSVTCGQLKPLVVGNNKKFVLLKWLADSPNKYHRFSDIAEGMGGDDKDVDALPALKCRLCKSLRENGFSALEKTIRVMDGHYGMFLN